MEIRATGKPYVLDGIDCIDIDTEDWSVADHVAAIACLEESFMGASIVTLEKHKVITLRICVKDLRPHVENAYRQIGQAHPMMKSRAFTVYLGRREIDTVFCDEDMTAEEVKHSLIDHDNYDPQIRVRKGKA